MVFFVLDDDGSHQHRKRPYQHYGDHQKRETAVPVGLAAVLLHLVDDRRIFVLVSVIAGQKRDLFLFAWLCW